MREKSDTAALVADAILCRTLEGVGGSWRELEASGNNDASLLPMLTPPALAADTIIGCLRDAYGLRICRVTFLPIGADVNTAIYRVEAEDGTLYFLKLRRGDF